MENKKYGECEKHPGNSMVDCSECFFERKILHVNIKNKITAEGVVDGIHDILFFGKGTNEENLQKAIDLMESVFFKLKKK